MALSTCANLYAQDNEKEIRAHQLLAPPMKDTACPSPALPLPFQERPNLATRLYVRTNTRRILPALLEELSHWMAPARLLSAKLLRALIVFYEDSLVDDLPTLLPALLKALALAHEVERKEDQEELAATLTHCAELTGWFCSCTASSSLPLDPSVFVPEDATTEGSSSSTSTRRRLARTTLLAHLRSGASEKE